MPVQNHNKRRELKGQKDNRSGQERIDWVLKKSPISTRNNVVLG